MTQAECKVETIKHIERVRHYLRVITDKLTTRGVFHDKTKLESPEIELFTEHTSKLATMHYNSDEYKESLLALKPALEHHYANSRHHPEHFSKGINDMNLVDSAIACLLIIPILVCMPEAILEWLIVPEIRFLELFKSITG